jgi:phosphoacetylglucosamine mutase
MASFCGIREELDKLGAPAKVFRYGTAGFRDDNTLLNPVLFRVGLLACARSEDVGHKAIGIMVRGCD